MRLSPLAAAAASCINIERCSFRQLGVPNFGVRLVSLLNTLPEHPVLSDVRQATATFVVDSGGLIRINNLGREEELRFVPPSLELLIRNLFQKLREDFSDTQTHLNRRAIGLHLKGLVPQLQFSPTIYPASLIFTVNCTELRPEAPILCDSVKPSEIFCRIITHRENANPPSFHFENADDPYILSKGASRFSECSPRIGEGFITKGVAPLRIMTGKIAPLTEDLVGRKPVSISYLDVRMGFKHL